MHQSRRRHRTHVRGTGALREILRYCRWGICAGVVGALAVAMFLLMIDLAVGRPFATPNALGATLFLGVPFDLARAPDPALIAGYSAVHGALFRRPRAVGELARVTRAPTSRPCARTAIPAVRRRGSRSPRAARRRRRATSRCGFRTRAGSC